MNDPYDTQVGGNHYQTMKIQPAEFINKNEMKFAEGNAIKYICRHVNKGGLQDLEKAKHYIDMIIERDYADEAKNSSVDSGVDISYEGLSHTFMANIFFAWARPGTSSPGAAGSGPGRLHGTWSRGWPTAWA